MKKAMAITMAAMALGSMSLLAQDRPILSINGLSLQAGTTMNVQYNGKVKDDLLAGTEKFAQGASKVDEINLDPATMGMMGRQYGPDANLPGKMKFVVVHDYVYDKPGMYRMEDVEAYVKKLEDGSWNCPVISREKDKLSYICVKVDSDQTNEMVIMDAAPQKLAFVHMAGSLSFNELTHMQDATKGLKVHDGPNPALKFSVPPAPPVPPAPAAKPQQ